MKISIIIPTLDEENAIEKTVRQFEKLQIPHEVVVSDSESKDQTVTIARRYADKVVELRAAHHTIALGKNEGAKVAQGNYFAFVDADVTIPDTDNFFKRALADFESNPRLVGLGSFIRVAPDVERRNDIFFRTVYNYFMLFMNNVLHMGIAAGEFQMVRAGAFKSIGGFNNNIVAGEDYDLFLRLVKIGRVRTDSSLVIYDQGRRAHAAGWVRLFAIWTINAMSVALFGKSMSKKWKEIR